MFFQANVELLSKHRTSLAIPSRVLFDRNCSVSANGLIIDVESTFSVNSVTRLSL